jgi:hypothetical protein
MILAKFTSLCELKRFFSGEVFLRNEIFFYFIFFIYQNKSNSVGSRWDVAATVLEK